MADDRTETGAEFQAEILRGIPEELPEMPPDEPGVNHAPDRPQVLAAGEREQAVKNALRYFPEAMHTRLAPEFARELATDGRIYMRRFRPTYGMKARPIEAYPARSAHAAAIMLMIQNNLDQAVAQHPHELITYGGNGTVFQNWAQYLLTMKYLAEMSDEQTLVLYSGHPLGLFPSHPEAPRLVLTNGMVIPNYSSRADYDRMAALGVTSYGQMTAGSFMYIGPQGIVHGTTITLLNAGRIYLGLKPGQGLEGRLFVTSGLGGMSGAQAKASVKMRYERGWLDEYEEDLGRLVARIRGAVSEKRAVSIGYLGNVVDLWEHLVSEGIRVDLGSDQTSLHNPFMGGYYPVDLSFAESNRMMTADPERFREQVYASLRRQVAAIDAQTQAGMRFWDYGNAFLLEASRAGAPGILKDDGSFAYPSYIEDIMGPICFDYGFGPFRWVCTSCRPEDLRDTDRIAADVLEKLAADAGPEIKQQMLDNVRWIRQAEENRLVVGSQARILYADRQGRIEIALAFNDAIAAGRVRAPIVLGRDHHDVSGTDSPYRETADIRDGSMFTADMAVHNFVGDAFRGATWVSLHNGGGVGWGEVVNGGFGLVLDGTPPAGERARRMLSWDVSNGLARRAWAGNVGAKHAIAEAMDAVPTMRVTLGREADGGLVSRAVEQAF
jgi:urocanate hydratase